jgi:hypothetical protein
LKLIYCLIAFLLIGRAVFAANPLPTPSNSPRLPTFDKAAKKFIPYHQLKLPTLNDEVVKGFIQYHQLTVDDFPINDQVDPGAGFRVRTFIHPFWLAQFRFSRSSIYEYIGEWTVFSGFDKNASSRKSWFREMQTELPYAQALLDINEIHARRLAALRSGELPRGQGGSLEATHADLTKKMKLFCEKDYEMVQTEMDEFAKATNKGSNQKKVRELGAEIKKRLAALPLPTASLSGLANTAATPMATAAASPTAAPQPK